MTEASPKPSPLKPLPAHVKAQEKQKTPQVEVTNPVLTEAEAERVKKALGLA
ncbi:hypothetical protein [Pseudarthrobacter chlorophenolicus]|uniref:hypothetical protein n=1 Tax=Pseudarthrobacter chlorophenolicus TaxID=85085 RepID=UPI000A6F78D3|nr:hypothetical protein [Pseudarthrobacter chlorophenolicus]